MTLCRTLVLWAVTPLARGSASRPTSAGKLYSKVQQKLAPPKSPAVSDAPPPLPTTFSSPSLSVTAPIVTSALERSVDMSVTSRLTPPPPPVLSRTGSGLAAEEAAAGSGSTEREKPRGPTPNPSGIYLTHLYLWYVHTQPIRYLPHTPCIYGTSTPNPSGIYLRHLYLWYVHTQPIRYLPHTPVSMVRLHPTHQVFTSHAIYGTSIPNPSSIYLTRLYLWYVHTQPSRYLPHTPVSMVRPHPTQQVHVPLPV